MKKYFLPIWVCLVFFTCHAFAQTSSDLGTLLNKVKTMQADFTQTVYDNYGKAVQQSHGHMAFERPGKFRWQVIKPIPQLIVANDSRLWIYDPDLEQVTIRVLKRAAGETPALLLSHVNNVLDADFIVKTLPQKAADLQRFSLKPRQSDNTFASIEMAFSKDQITEMKLEDHLGHTTLVKFSHAQINTPLANSLFTFKASAKVDVIDETRKK